MLQPAAADLAAAGLTLTIEGSRATVTVDRQDRGAACARAVPAVGVLADIGRCLPGSIRLVLLRIIGGLPPFDHVRVDPTAAGGRDRPGMAGDCPGMAGDCPASPASPGFVGDRQCALDWLSRPDLFSIAVVSGWAVGALRLALACDLRVFCADAYLAMDGIRHGRVPALGVSDTLVDLVGYGRALDLCVTGRAVSGTQAYMLGLADRVAAPVDLADAVEDLAAALLAPPRGLAVEVKALLLHSRERSRPDQRRAERDAQLRAERDAQLRTSAEAVPPG
ncbi:MULTISPECIES: enoyl-CoA hydratase/isomerase family protein [unclassified Frankia]|uniref:enoyl-CoA hydratase/isomerase family protein n=1 Tax=unclassified Frankia TaxID=2632575 RepID=UPI002AD37786|nr:MULTISPECIES: enoyl-CoA hydratase/isomerase family protein [unclassified Frankia]